MNRAALHEGLRRMRFETILDRQKGGEITQLEAAEMCRSLRSISSFCSCPVLIGHQLSASGLTDDHWWKRGTRASFGSSP